MLSFDVMAKTKRGETISGDSFLSFSIGLYKHIFIICDGMGSGEMAHAQSYFAADKLRFYIESGKDMHAAINTVSSEVRMRNADCFSTADVLILDTDTMTGRLIKAGAAPTLILRKGKTDLFSTCTLPLGILYETNADEFSFSLSCDTRILMFSDGLLSEDGADDVTVFYIKFEEV